MNGKGSLLFFSKYAYNNKLRILGFNASVVVNTHKSNHIRDTYAIKDKQLKHEDSFTCEKCRVIAEIYYELNTRGI